MIKIGIIGECMIELSQQSGNTHLAFGGDTLNTAVYLARLLYSKQFSVYYVTALGTDPYSEDMLQQWKEENLQTDLVQKLHDKLPGLYAIVTDSYGERSFYYWRNDSAARYWLKTEQSNHILAQLLEFDYLYLSGISLAILEHDSLQKLFEFIAQFKQRGGKLIFDNNYRPRLWQHQEKAQKAYRQILSYTDIAFLTLDDEEKLWGHKDLNIVIQHAVSLGVREVVIKRGADSCIVQNKARYDIPDQKVKQVIDTTAAGDSFSAGYLSARLQGLDEVASGQEGHKIASKVIQYPGAIIAKALF